MEYVIAGVFLGALYAVLAGGLVLVYRVSKVLNFAAGSLGTATAYVYWQLTEDWHWSTAAAALVAIACGVVVSAASGVAFDLGSVNITHHQVATIVWGAVYALLLHLWLRRTDTGLGLRAMSEDDEVAVLHGVRPLR